MKGNEDIAPWYKTSLACARPSSQLGWCGLKTIRTNRYIKDRKKGSRMNTVGIHGKKGFKDDSTKPYSER